MILPVTDPSIDIEAQERACLLCTYPTQSPLKLFRIGNHQLTMGRSAECDVSLSDESTSRVHAIMHQRDGMLILRDNGSTNGTFVNGVRTDETRLVDNDVIFVGNTLLRVLYYIDERQLSERVAYIQATTDPLTGSRKLAFLIDHMNGELALSQRSSRDLSLLVCRPVDVNQPQVKITPKVLQCLASRLPSTLRRENNFARLGEYDAFTVLAPDCNRMGVIRIADRLQEVTRMIRHSMEGDINIRLAISAAYGPFPRALPPHQIIRALYANCVDSEADTAPQVRSGESLIHDFPLLNVGESFSLSRDTWTPSLPESSTVFDGRAVK